VIIPLPFSFFQFETKPFTPEDILYIANKAEDRKDMYTSVRFLETLLNEFKKGNFPDSSLSVIRIAKATASAYNRVSKIVSLMVFNTTFNNISVISWRQFLLVEETGGTQENHRPVASP